MATTYVSSLKQNALTDAEFRTVGQSIYDGLVASGGLVATSDPQVNWTTVSRPTGTTETYASSYTHLRFNDSLQATKPVFLKIEWGHIYADATPTPSTRSDLAIRITVAKGTDGSGTLTSPSTTFKGAVVGSSSTANSALHICATTSGFVIASASTTSSTNSMFIFLERRRNIDGTLHSSGDLVGGTIDQNQTNKRLHHYYDYAGATLSSRGSTATAYPFIGFEASQSSGSYLGLEPFHARGPYGYTVPPLALVGYYSTDIATGTTFSMTYLNESHTYKALGTDQLNFGLALGSTSTGVAIRWE